MAVIRREFFRYPEDEDDAPDFNSRPGQFAATNAIRELTLKLTLVHGAVCDVGFSVAPPMQSG